MEKYGYIIQFVVIVMIVTVLAVLTKADKGFITDILIGITLIHVLEVLQELKTKK